MWPKKNSANCRWVQALDDWLKSVCKTLRNEWASRAQKWALSDFPKTNPHFPKRFSVWRSGHVTQKQSANSYCGGFQALGDWLKTFGKTLRNEWATRIQNLVTGVSFCMLFHCRNSYVPTCTLPFSIFKVWEIGNCFIGNCLPPQLLITLINSLVFETEAPKVFWLIRLYEKCL